MKIELILATMILIILTFGFWKILSLHKEIGDMHSQFLGEIERYSCEVNHEGGKG